MKKRTAARAEDALDLLHKGKSPSAVVTFLSQGVGGGPCSRRTAQRAVADAFDLFRDDYEESGWDRRALTAQVINLLLEGCQMCLHTNQPGALAASVGQLDWIVGLSDHPQERQ